MLQFRVCVAGSILLIAVQVTQLSRLAAQERGAAPPSAPGAQTPRLDYNQDPLPAGALARLGTIRLRHGGAVTFVSFIEQDKFLLTAGLDQQIHVWDLASGKQVRSFKREARGRDQSVSQAGIMAGGGMMIVSSSIAGPFQVALSADGKTLAAAGSQGEIQLWETATGRLLGSLSTGQTNVAGLSLSPDGKRAAAQGYDSTILIWDIGRGGTPRKLSPESKSKDRRGAVAFFGGASRPLFTPDGKSLLCTSSSFANGQVTIAHKLWDVETGKELRVLSSKQLAGGFHSARFSPDGKTLALGDMAGSIHLLDSATGKEVRTLKMNAPFARYTFTADGKQILTHSPLDQSIRLWDSATGKELKQIVKPRQTQALMMAGFDAGTDSMSLAADGKRLALAGEGNAVRVVDLETGKTWLPVAGHNAPLDSIEFAADGRTIRTHGQDGSARSWDAGSGKPLAEEKIPPLFMHNRISADGRLIAGMEPDGTIRVLEIANGKEIAVFKPGQQGAPAFEFSPDGKWLAIKQLVDQGVELHSLTTAKEVRRLGEPLKDEDRNRPAGVVMIAPAGQAGMIFSPDGRYLAVPSKHNALVLWDVDSGKTIRTVSLGENQILRSAFFSPDSRSLAVVTPDEKLELYEVATGERRHEYRPSPGGRGAVRNTHAVAMGRIVAANPGGAMMAMETAFGGSSVVAFSKDGRVVAGVRNPNIVILWDALNGKELGRIDGHPGTVTALTFAPDGNRLATGGSDTTGLIWDCTHLVKQAAGEPRALTQEQLDAACKALGGQEAARAFEAVGRLVKATNQAVPAIEKLVPQAVAVDEKRVNQLIADLDSNRFKVRQQASVELDKLGEIAVPALRKALEAKPSAEVRKRVEEIIEKASGRRGQSVDRLLALRSVEVLETIATPEARQLLRKLAAGAPGASQTQAAQDALQRLGK